MGKQTPNRSTLRKNSLGRCNTSYIYFVYKIFNFTLYCAARKRAVYDQFGEEGLKNGVPSGSGEGGAWTQGYTFHANPDKVFRDFFGGDNPFQG